jgi:hypothetical protein
MDLIFNPTRRVTSADFGLTCDLIEFEIKTAIPRPVRRLMVQFEQENDSDPAAACDIAGQVIVSWSQDGKSHSFDQATAEALRAQINEQMAGAGDEFICTLVGGLVANHYNFFLRRIESAQQPDPGDQTLAGEPAG